jgi:hypothetical protein
MANIVGPTNITPKTTMLRGVTGATGTVVVNNAAASGKAIQIVSLYAANVDGSSAVDVTVKMHDQDDGGGNGTAVASTVSVPADATVIIVDKNSQLWLEEDRSIVVTPSASNDIEIVCSYLELS